MQNLPSVERVEDFTRSWFSALDRHVDDAEILEYLTDDISIVLLTGAVIETREALFNWYHDVINSYFDQVHTLIRIEVQIAEESIKVTVAAHWSARIRKAPAPKSEVFTFREEQTWRVLLHEDRGLAIQHMTVTGFRIVSGSPERFEYLSKH